MNSNSLLRYNFRVLIFNNWWLLVFPLAASQFAVFWNIITHQTGTMVPAQTVEMVTPLLGAFLSAHILSAEYQARIGAILASKPVNLGKVVLLRLLVVLGLTFALAGLSLAAYFFGMKPYDLLPPALACLPSTLFLSLFALTFATLLRHSLAGFGMAALYWALDLPPGPPMHPYLTLHSLSTAIAGEPGGNDPFNRNWVIAKIILLIGAVLLYIFHSRLVFGLGTSMTKRQRVRTLAIAGALFSIYLISGATVKVSYAYSHRTNLPPDDAAWIRNQFSTYGPIPLSLLFGPAFNRYIGEVPNAWKVQQEGETNRWGDTDAHRRGLHEVVTRMSGSVWAASAAELLARTEGAQQKTPETKLPYYDRIVQSFPDSPYYAYALRETARTYEDAGQPEKAEAGFQTLLQKKPDSPYRTEAMRYLFVRAKERGDRVNAEKWAREWTQDPPIQEKYLAWLALAEVLKEKGDVAGAKQAAAETLKAVRAFRMAVAEEKVIAPPGQINTWSNQANQADTKAQAIQHD